MKSAIIAAVAGLLLMGATAVDAKTYRWYDGNGVVHFTYYPPPEGARNKDGSPYILPPEAPPAAAPTPAVRAPVSHPSPPPDAAPPVPEKTGALEKITSFFGKNSGPRAATPAAASRNTSGRSMPSCNYPRILEKFGICPLQEPRSAVSGSTFKAVVLDARKVSWSSCRVTRDGDFLIFVNKGNGYWETDAGIPACPFREGFTAGIFD